MKKNREKKRYPANWVMVRLPGSNPTMGRLCDISESGLHFMYNAEMEEGRCVPVEISLKYLVKNPFKVEDLSFDMEIVWRKEIKDSQFKFSYGAKFDLSQTGMDDETKANIIRFLDGKLAKSKK